MVLGVDEPYLPVSVTVSLSGFLNTKGPRQCVQFFDKYIQVLIHTVNSIQKVGKMGKLKATRTGDYSAAFNSLSV